MLKKEGFTLIELVMVIIILGILAAVAIPRYVDMVATAEAGAEDAVIARIKAGLEIWATNKLITEGRRTWTANPFRALETKPDGYDPNDNDDADSDGEWTFNQGSGGGTSYITHQRGDNTKWRWSYAVGDTASANAAPGTLGIREPIP